MPDKYDGYAQFRCPRGYPWDNQTLNRDKKMNPRTIKKWIAYGKTSFELQSPRNSSLWENHRKYYEHLTAPLNKYQRMKAQSPESMSKELNNGHWTAPNTTILEKSLLKIKIKEKEENEKKVQEESMKKKNIPVNITVSRYNSKISNGENRTISFPANFRETQNLMRSYVETKANESLNLSEIAQTTGKYKTKTFKGSFAFRSSSFDKNVGSNLKTEKEILDRVTREREEMTGYIVNYFS